MSTIPTPFIGGAGGPPVDRGQKGELAPPFYSEDAGSAVTKEPKGAPEPVIDEPQGDPLPTAAEPEELIDQVFSESLEVAVEPQEEPAPAAAPLESAEDAPFELDSAGMPDFLEGPDAIGPDRPVAETPAPAAASRPATADEVSAQASRLLDGAMGDWIRELAAELGVADPTAIARAFAAGYLAARTEGEN